MLRQGLLILGAFSWVLVACSSHDDKTPVAPALCQVPADNLLPWHADSDFLSSIDDPCHERVIPNSLAVAGGTVYYATVAAICSVDHEGKVTDLMDLRTVTDTLPARALWVKNNTLVFVNGIAIYTASVTGGTPTQVAALSWPFDAIIVTYGFDGSYVYWGTEGGELASVFRISLAGGSVENLGNESGFGAERIATAADQVDFVPIANFSTDSKPLWRIQPSTGNITSLGDVSWAGALLTDNGSLAYVRAGNRDLKGVNEWDDSALSLYTIDGNGNRQAAWDGEGFPHLAPYAAAASSIGVYVGGRFKFRDGDYVGIGQIPSSGQPRTVLGCLHGDNVDAVAVDVDEVYALVGAKLNADEMSHSIVRFRPF